MISRDIFMENTSKKERTDTIFFLENKTIEAHFMLQSPKGYDTLKSWEFLQTQINTYCQDNNFDQNNILFLRVFFSDIRNQIKILKKNFPEIFEGDSMHNISFVQQQPLPRSKLAVWVYLVKGKHPVEKTEVGNILKSNGLTHIWTSNLMGSENSTPKLQTRQMFIHYTEILKKNSAALHQNCIRTWVFGHDVDRDYMDIVNGRKEFFEEHGLTQDSHYIASTGIEGRGWKTGHHVLMDAYSVKGIKPEQIKHLHAPTHFCPTHKYGVTFERGTEILYGDRKHVIISGTASINNKGDILYPNDIIKQTKRVVENITALLNEANCSLMDLVSVLVYIRDMADYQIVKKLVVELLPNIPGLILLAPVCRPAWLVEIEGIAIKQGETEWMDF